MPDVELGDPSFYPTLQAYAGAPIVGGNLAHAVPVTHEQWTRRGIRARLFEWLVMPLREQL